MENVYHLRAYHMRVGMATLCLIDWSGVHTYWRNATKITVLTGRGFDGIGTVSEGGCGSGSEVESIILNL